MKIIAYSLLLAFLLISCSANRYINLIEKEIDSDIKVDLNIDSIRVFDHRTNISDNDIKLPFISYPKQLIRNNPPLDSIHIEIIKKTINQSCAGEGGKIQLNANIIKAYKEFSATFASEKEKVYVEIQLDMIDDCKNLSVLCSSHAEYSLILSDAKKKSVEALYLLAFKGAIISCLEKIKDESKTPFINE